MPSPPDNIGEYFVFGLSVLRVRPFVRPIVRTDLVTTVSYDWREQSQLSLQGIFNSPY